MIPRAAATIALLRDGERGPEVLMMRRTHLAEFASGVYVFPGGAVDAADSDPALATLARGMDDAQAFARGHELKVARLWVWPLRMLRRGGTSPHVSREGLALVDHSEVLTAVLAEARGVPVFGAGVRLVDFLSEANLILATDKLAYLSRWITQSGRPRRFDTRFFVARAPSRQQSAHDGTELLHHVWLMPTEVLARYSRGELMLLYPTIKTLQTLAEFGTVDEALEYARSDRAMQRSAARRWARRDRRCYSGEIPLTRKWRWAGRNRDGEVRDRSGQAGPAVAAHNADHSAQRGHDDRPRNEHLLARRCDSRHRGHRSRAGDRKSCQCDC
jgi:hypothetical protein